MSRLNSRLKMIFSNDTSVFIPESCVSDNPIRYERTRTPTDDHKYYHGIIALKASGRDCTNKNELLHKTGVLQLYAMQLFVFTR